MTATTASTHVDAHLAGLLEAEVATWDAEGVAVVLVGLDGPMASSGDISRRLRWASVTKILSALAVLDVVADDLLDLDEPAGPPGSTVRHLLGHTSGLAFGDDRVVAVPGVRRTYSNTGIDVVTELARTRAGEPDAAALIGRRVLLPLRMSRTSIDGPAAYGAVGPARDLARLAHELLEPHVLPGAVTAAIEPSFPGLAGLLPGFGRQAPNDWGLGIELRGTKSPHWMPASAPATAFGHFGQSGSFLWVDREAGLSAVSVSATPFGEWAAQAWPASGQVWRGAWVSGTQYDDEGAHR